MLYLVSNSSNATLPVSMETETAQKELEVPESISSFVQPLGVTINMDEQRLGKVGLPVAGIDLILGIDRLLDIARTDINITGDFSLRIKRI